MPRAQVREMGEESGFEYFSRCRSSMIHDVFVGILGLLAGQRFRASRYVIKVTPTARPIPFAGAPGAAVLEDRRNLLADIRR
jgi:hypothetical protein